MILFDIIHGILKCWFRFEFCCFNSVVHNKRMKIIVIGCTDFRNKELWWNLDWYFIDNFSSLWEAWCLWVDRNHFFFNMCWLLILLFHVIHKLFFYMFETFIRFIKHSLEFGLMAIFRRLSFRSEIKHFILMWYDDNLFGSICCFPLNSINSSSGCSKIWLYGENLAWNFLSKSSSEDVCDNPTINSSLVRYDSYWSHKPHGTSKPPFPPPKGYFPSITSISKIQSIQK